ncbi:MAG: hypothetical protein LPL29_03900 [Alphaproteobacteria bacterium]|nr:hypothetical protein [Alphaproteobacteria bacterium]
MESDLRTDLRIDMADIDREIVNQPGLFAHYAAQHAEAERKLKLAKLEFEVFEAALDRQVRDHALATNKKVTERQIETAMFMNTTYVDKRRNLIELEAQVEQIKAVVDGMRQKKDMLITFASNARAEMQQGFAIRDKGGTATSFYDGKKLQSASD